MCKEIIRNDRSLVRRIRRFGLMNNAERGVSLEEEKNKEERRIVKDVGGRVADGKGEKGKG